MFEGIFSQAKYITVAPHKPVSEQSSSLEGMTEPGGRRRRSRGIMNGSEKLFS